VNSADSATGGEKCGIAVFDYRRTAHVFGRFESADVLARVGPKTPYRLGDMGVFRVFDATERHQAAIEILRRSIQIALHAVDDQTLILHAEELFLNLDKEEAVGERSRAP
jgi:hypothetical protein